MTWLVVTSAHDDGDLASVFAALPEEYATPYEHLVELHRSAWAMTDADLLEIGLAQMAEGLGYDGDLGIDVDPARAASAAARAVRAYAEMFVLDANSIAPELTDALARDASMSQLELYRFVAALSTLEVCLRACIVLGVDPRLPREASRDEHDGEPAAAPAPPTDGIGLREYYKSVLDPRFARARSRYGASVVRLSAADALTTEAVRLRNATFQQCRY